MALGGLFLAALVLSSCGGSSNSDASALKTQVAVLQTQVAAPAPTAVPTAIPTAMPRDVVVEITYSCSTSTGAGTAAAHIDVQPPSPQGGHSVCETAARTGQFQNPSFLIFNVFLDLKVRTPSGTVYSARVGGPSSVSIGDPWPPK